MNAPLRLVQPTENSHRLAVAVDKLRISGVDDLGPVMDDWGVWMDAADMAARTIKDRIEGVELFAARMNLNPMSAGWRDIAAFLALDPSWRPGTKRTRYAQLRAFYRWLNITDQRVDDPMLKLKKPKAPRGLPHPVPASSLTAILRAANRRRTHGMVVLAICQGLRAHEVAKFRGEDVRGGKVRGIGKGGVEFAIPAHPLVIEEAKRFPAIGWWFASPDDPSRPVTSGNVSKVVSGCIRRAGVSGFTAHSLRHFYGTELLRSSGGNLRLTQEGMRHASPASTAIYTKVDDDELRDAIHRLPIPLHAV